MTAVRRGLPICLLALVALATGSARAEQPAPRGRARRGRRLALAEAARDDDVARRPAGADADAGERPRRASRRRIEAAVPDAQIRWRYRLVANGMAVVVPSAQLGRLTSLPGIETVYPSVQLPPAARSQPAADRRARPLGPRARKRRPGDQDRDHRRGDRPDAPVLLARRLHDARRLPEGPDGLHDRQGDRRARLPARQPDVEARRRSRSTPSCPRTARMSPGSRPGTRTRSPTAPASPASRRAPTSATTRR